ncbi:MAG TPA: sigma-70 family RNA polymerase sigma factor [Steroidobacteraceae bacterium]|jgi:RNA polymerase sigma factor (TIGR02999 family)|nr:sigma-70 family RNA polymerase sigma factor [Steroidobacteraceae bacterium]
MNNKPAGEVTQLLLRWRAGDEAALAALLPLVYEELRSLARRHLRHERGSHTLQRTALVHEAFLRIVDQKQVDWESRTQFYGIASQMMRRVLVDHARRRSAAKRGDGAPHVDLDVVLQDEGAGLPPGRQAEIDFAAIDDALKRLEALDPQQGKLVELRFFGGLSIKETADVIGVSPATVKREWAIARAWLQREIMAGASA